jgi:hypothetical protein
VPAYSDIERAIVEKSGPDQLHLPIYDYLVYLRHHGFPSPLLDWTESPFIAAYFAYMADGSRDPAVYCYIERPQLAKGWAGGAPRISVYGTNVKTHKRHFAQKASYTVATRWDYQLGANVFCPHEQVFGEGSVDQDVLVKIILPSSERITAMRQLADFNINHFTLFQSEDSLVKALEAKFFELQE